MPVLNKSTCSCQGFFCPFFVDKSDFSWLCECVWVAFTPEYTAWGRTHTFPSWASLMLGPVDVVRRRLFPPNVLRPLIRLARPVAPWAAPPGAAAPTVPVAAGTTVRPSSSVTKKVDHMSCKTENNQDGWVGFNLAAKLAMPSTGSTKMEKIEEILFSVCP